MFEFSKKFGVNDKLAFRLYPELLAESYTLLVKKVKDNLVAAVVSNNDKNSVNPNINDEIYLFSEANGRSWVTKTLVMQTNAYPLMILSIAEEPWALAPDIEEETHAPVGDLESAEHAYPPAVNDVKSYPAAGKGTVKSDDDDDLSTMPSITIRELTAEHERAQGQEGMRFGSEDLDALPDIDTSDLEAELDADIEDTLEKRRKSFTASPDVKDEEPSQEPLVAGLMTEPDDEDDLSDMTIVKDRSMEIGDFEEDDIATLEVGKPGEQKPLELDIVEPQGEPEALDEERLYVGEVEAEDEAPLATEPFHDFFTAYLTPVANPAVRTAVVMAGLTEDGFKAVMDEAPMSGARFTVEIDRPWNPSLFLRAMAVAESSYSVSGITLAQFGFEGLDNAGRMAVRAYLDGRAGYFRSLADLARD